MTTQQPPYVEVDLYVQLDPKLSKWDRRADRPGEPVIEGMKHVATTTTKPFTLRGRIVTKLRVRLPASVFDPLEPSAVVTLDESQIVRREEVVVEAVTGEPED